MCLSGLWVVSGRRSGGAAQGPLKHKYRHHGKSAQLLASPASFSTSFAWRKRAITRKDYKAKSRGVGGGRSPPH